MNLVVSLTGVVIGLLAAVGIFAPFTVLGWIRDWHSPSRWVVAVVQRAVLGSIFIMAAPSCRTPRIIFWLGVLTLVAAAVILLAGPRRLDAVVNWWLGLPASVVVASFAGAAAFGCFLVYAGW